MKKRKLVLEVNKNFAENTTVEKLAKSGILITPPLDGENYWTFKVKVTQRQAVIGFQKFGTIGIGFLKEQDWNTNLPFKCETMEIYNHIKHNKGKTAKESDCIEAIEMIQNAAKEMMK